MKHAQNKIVKIAKQWIVSTLCFIIRHTAKVNHKLIVLHSSPDFSDNAKALYDYMIANGYDKDFDIYFAVEHLSRCESLWGDKARFIQFYDKHFHFDWAALRKIMTAGHLIYTHSAPFPLTHCKGLKEQIQVNLWHGCGYKEKTTDVSNKPPLFDRVLVPGNLHIVPKAAFWNVRTDQIIAKGYPRYDWMLNPSDAASEMKQKYASDGKKCVMWMPTFRSDKNGVLNQTASIKQFPLIATPQQWQHIDELCGQLGITLLVKLHQIQRDYGIDFDTMANIERIGNDDFDKNGVNLYEFLAMTDGLITDYSSVAFDYLIVDKPIGFALEDYETYKSMRGFIFDDPLQYMPGHHMYCLEDLERFLRDVASGSDPHKADRDRVKAEAIHPSTHYCKDIAQVIFS